MSEEKYYYYTPPIRKFEDTGFVSHKFGDGSTITGEVVESSDSGGFAIHLVIESDGEEVCNFTMDRFAALCLSDVITKNLLNQEEVQDAVIRERNEEFNRKCKAMGEGQKPSRPESSTE